MRTLMIGVLMMVFLMASSCSLGGKQINLQVFKNKPVAVSATDTTIAVSALDGNVVVVQVENGSVVAYGRGEAILKEADANDLVIIVKQ